MSTFSVVLCGAESVAGRIRVASIALNFFKVRCFARKAGFTAFGVCDRTWTIIGLLFASPRLLSRLATRCVVFSLEHVARADIVSTLYVEEGVALPFIPPTR